MRNKYFSLTMAIALLLLQFTIIRIGSFPLTLMPFLMVIILIYFFDLKKTKLSSSIFLLIALCYPFIVYSFNVLHSQYYYMKTGTFLLYINAVFWLYCVFSYKIKRIVSISEVEIFLKIFVIILLGMVVLQIVFANIFHNLVAHLVIEPFSYTGKLILPEIGTVAYIRPIGFYLEPSYLGLVSLFGLNCLYLVRSTSKLTYLMFATCIVLSLSLTAIILSLAQSFLILSKKYSFFNKFLILCFGIFSLSLVAIQVGHRLEEILIPGTSGYYRYSAPFFVARYTLEYSPLGINLGAISNYMESFGFYNGAGIGTSVDNGVFVLIIYFGMVGFGFVLFLLFFVLIQYLSSNRTSYKKFVLGSFGLCSLLFNGGIFLPDFVFLIFFLLFIYKVISNENIYNHSSVQ